MSRSFISHEINLKCMAAISHMINKTDLTVCTHKITNMIKMLINPVSPAADIISDSFHCYKLHLEAFIVSEQKYIMIQGYAIIYETNR